uniref:Putative secreted protein n=1 Tax=Ixodes scapularis TaxID=6945 RepID=A0A4D5RF08_IXOSC
MRLQLLYSSIFFIDSTFTQPLKESSALSCPSTIVQNACALLWHELLLPLDILLTRFCFTDTLPVKGMHIKKHRYKYKP